MPPELVVVGTSLGGLHALTVLFSGLPRDFPLPVVIAQHRSTDSPGALETYLQAYSALPIVEIEDKASVRPGCIYLAPADYHVLLEAGAFALSTEAPVTYARPSIDVLFASAADAYGERAIGVILTGASQDGTHGLAQIKRRGGLAVVESPATAECPVMPQAAIAATPVDWVLPLEQIAAHLVSLCRAQHVTR